MFVSPSPHYVTGLTKFAYRLKMKYHVTGIDLVRHTAVEVTMVAPLMSTMVAVAPLLEAIVHDVKITAIAPHPAAAATTTIPETATALHLVGSVALPSRTTLRLEATAVTLMPPRLPAVTMTSHTPTVVMIARREQEPHPHEHMAAGMRSVHVTGINSLSFDNGKLRDGDDSLSN